MHLAHRLDTSLTQALSLKVWHFLAIFRSLIFEEGANCLTRAPWILQGCDSRENVFIIIFRQAFFFQLILSCFSMFSISLSIFQRRTFHFISAKVWKIADSRAPFFSSTKFFFYVCVPAQYLWKNIDLVATTLCYCVSLLLTSWFSKSRDKSLLHGWQKGVKKNRII